MFDDNLLQSSDVLWCYREAQWTSNFWTKSNKLAWSKRSISPFQNGRHCRPQSYKLSRVALGTRINGRQFGTWKSMWKPNNRWPDALLSCFISRPHSPNRSDTQEAIKAVKKAMYCSICRKLVNTPLKLNRHSFFENVVCPSPYKSNKRVIMHVLSVLTLFSGFNWLWQRHCIIFQE